MFLRACSITGTAACAAAMALLIAGTAWAGGGGHGDGGLGGTGARGRGGVVQLGVLKSRTPVDWVEEKPDEALRLKQYRLEAVGDDKDSGRLTIDFLGNGKRTAKEHVQRWKEMFLPPKGRNMDEAAKVLELEVGGAKATYLDVRGDSKGIPGNPRTPRQNFRLLGVYFDAPQGPYLIRLFGPADTVEFYRRGFEHWVKGFE